MTWLANRFVCGKVILPSTLRRQFAAMWATWIFAVLLIRPAAAEDRAFPIEVRRDGLPNVFARLKAGEPTAIAYLGGSITAGAGSSDSNKTSWRARTTAWFKARYPQAAITEINAAIGGTGSELGAFRTQSDVLAKKPNLVFVEFAVNDNSAADATIDRAMEGIVRQIRRADPKIDICFVYTVCVEQLDTYKSGKLPHTVVHQDAVAAHYGIPAVNMGAAALDRINHRKLTFAEFTKDGYHPTDAGYLIYTDVLTSFLAGEADRATLASPHAVVPPLHAGAWDDAHLVEAASLPIPTGWALEAKPSLDGMPRAVTADAPGTSLSLPFRGGTFGLYYIVGPDTGQFEYKIDGGPWQKFACFDQWALQYPRGSYRILADHLADAPHSFTLRISSEKDAKSKGTWTRLLYLLQISK